MTLKTRLAKLEIISKVKEPLKVLFYFPEEQTLEAAKAAKGWQHVPDNQLRIICFEVVE